MLARFFWPCFFLFGLVAGISAKGFIFNHLTVYEGLSHHSVLSLYQDELGRIWMGTPLGLNSYDGRSVKIFDKSQERRTLCNDHILKVTGDKKGHVYILTKSSFEVFDIKGDSICSRYALKQGNEIVSIDYQEHLYAIFNKNVLSRWNMETKQFEEVYRFPKEMSVYTFLVDSHHVIWVATLKKAYRLDLKKKELRTVLQDKYVYTISQSTRGELLIGTRNNGLYIFNDQGEQMQHVSMNDGLRSNDVRAVCQDDWGSYWVGTNKGLIKLDEQYRVSEQYLYDDNEGSLTNSSIYSLLKDTQGNIWIGTYFGGVNWLHPQRERYAWHHVSQLPSKGLSSSIVRDVLEDKRRWLWIATEGGGLTCYRPETDSYEWFQHSAIHNSIAGNSIKSLYYDEKKDVLWIGTHLQGLSCLDIEKKRFTNYTLQVESEVPLKNEISGIVADGDTLIISSYEGVFCFYPQTGIFKKILDVTFVRTLFLDSQRILWLATTRGKVFAYDLNKTQMLRLNYVFNISKKHWTDFYPVYDIVEDGEQNIWMATFGGGLRCFDKKHHRMEVLSMLNSHLISDNLLALCVADSTHLLLTFRNGYSLFDFKNKTFEDNTHDTGFPLSYLNENALFCTSDGTICIGGDRCMLTFNENKRRSWQKDYQIYFNRLKVNGEEVWVNQADGILSQSMPYTSELNLAHCQNTITIDVATSNYVNRRGNELEYRLEGVSDNWNVLSPEQYSLTFYDLSPGEYHLLVREKGNTNHEPIASSLKIVVRPPFYLTVYAYLFYLLFLIGMIILLLHTYYRWVHKKAYLRYEEKRVLEEKAANQWKMQFFVNVSHEFCTPLTIIIGQLDLLKKEVKDLPVISERLQCVYNNAMLLKDLIYELLDFKKQDTSEGELKVAKCDLCRLAYESFLLYKEYADSKGIDLRFQKSLSSLDIWGDYKQLGKVINNLLSNAIKYTEAGGSILLAVETVDDKAVVRVADTGCGMEQDDLSGIFSYYYQGKQSAGKRGTGIGLALVKKIVDAHGGTVDVASSPGVGTTFTVCLQSGKEYFLSKNLLLSEEETKQMSTSEPQEVTLSSNSDGMKFTMLIVEDNVVLREMLLSVFSSLYNVISAPNGAVAWEYLQKTAVDIVVSDIMMPEMSGTELCQRIKDDLRICHIPVILLSVRADIQNNIEGLKAGADDYIKKPFSIDLLITRCNNLLHNRKLVQNKFVQLPYVSSDTLTTNALDKEFMDKIIKCIEENIDNHEFNIDFLLKELLISRSALFQKLKAISGQTPSEFILNIRLKKAAVYLKKNPEMSIATVSDCTGFSSPKYFSRIFKERYHIRPIDYRNGKEIAEGE